MTNMDTPLLKHQLEPGSIVWLREDTHTINEHAFKQSKLRWEMVHHPVLVVNLLEEDHDYIWICLCTSSNRDGRNLPIAFSKDTFCLPCENVHAWPALKFSRELFFHHFLHDLPVNFTTTTIAAKTNILYHRDPSALMCKPTHVNIKTVYEVPVSFLRPLEDRFGGDGISSHALDPLSMAIVHHRTKAAIGKLEAKKISVHVERDDQPRQEGSWGIGGNGMQWCAVGFFGGFCTGLLLARRWECLEPCRKKALQVVQSISSVENLK